MLTCLSEIVGLSPASVPCFTDSAPSGYNNSSSGYFLTDPDFGIGRFLNCSFPGWGILANARTQAARDFEVDLGARMRDGYVSTGGVFSGIVGKMKFSGVALPTQGRVGQRWKPYKKRGGRFIIKKIHIGVDVSAAYEVVLNSNLPGFVRQTVSVNATANVFTPVAVNWEIPFYSKYECEPEFYISFARGAAKPLNNVFSCCSDNPAYREFLDVAGYQGSDEIGGNGAFDSGAGGLVIEGYLDCAGLNWVCDVQELGGFDMSLVIARTIQFRAAAVALAEISTRGDFNACTLYNPAGMTAQQNFLNTRYAENVRWLAENMPAGASDCWACKPDKYFTKTNIIL